MYEKDGMLDCERIRKLILEKDGVESCEYCPTLPFRTKKMMGFVWRKNNKRKKEK